jgi:hypothetical protein
MNRLFLWKLAILAVTLTLLAEARPAHPPRFPSPVFGRGVRGEGVTPFPAKCYTLACQLSYKLAHKQLCFCCLLSTYLGCSSQCFVKGVSK